MRRDLHSFPTRRSSDLSNGMSHRYSRHLTATSCQRSETSETDFFVRNCRITHLSISHSWRSEEHTSELQSRRELVCRLLLDKKNNHIMQCANRLGVPAV